MQAVHSVDVLHADDYELGRRFVRDLLKAWGYSVHTVKNGSQAVAWMQEILAESGNADGLRPRCLLLNYFMPEMTGLDALRIIRRLEREHGLSPTPVIAYSSYLTDDERQGFEELGVQAILHTPFGLQELQDTLQACLKER